MIMCENGFVYVDSTSWEQTDLELYSLIEYIADCVMPKHGVTAYEYLKSLAVDISEEAGNISYSDIKTLDIEDVMKNIDE